MSSQLRATNPHAYTIVDDGRPSSGSGPKCQPDIFALQTVMSNMLWNITQLPEEAQVKAANDKYRLISVHELSRAICSGRMVLYLPLNPGASDIAVYMKVVIKKREIRIWDILWNIWSAYNCRPIKYENLLAVLESRESEDHVKQLILDHEQGTYVVRMRHLLQERATNALSASSSTRGPSGGNMTGFEGLHLKAGTSHEFILQLTSY